MIVDSMGYNFPDVPLNEMKDKALLLSMAGEYLCEDYFLKKAGMIIGSNAEALKDYIGHTQEQFVGKSADEARLNDILQSILHTAELLQQADGDIKEECSEGKLGTELFETIKSLGQGIKALEQRIDGKAIVPVKREPLRFIINPFKFLLKAIIATSKLGLKLAATLIIIGLAVFSFLYFTMESEEAFVQKIEQSQADIRSAQARLSEINNELEELREELAGIREDEADRRDEIEVIDLNLKIYKLSEEQQKAQIDMDMERESLEENLRNLEKLRQKSFLEKLLRM